MRSHPFAEPAPCRYKPRSCLHRAHKQAAGGHREHSAFAAPKRCQNSCSRGLCAGPCQQQLAAPCCNTAAAAADKALPWTCTQLPWLAPCRALAAGAVIAAAHAGRGASQGNDPLGDGQPTSACDSILEHAAAGNAASAAAAGGAHVGSSSSSSSSSSQQPQALLWSEDDFGILGGELGMDAASSSSGAADADTSVPAAVGQKQAMHGALPWEAALTPSHHVDQQQQQQQQQQLYHRHGHHRQKQRMLMAAQQQQETDQEQQPLEGHALHPAGYVGLLQQVALVRSWPAAARLLRRHPQQLQQAHVGLLWWQLKPQLLLLQQQQAQQAHRAQQALQQHDGDSFREDCRSRSSTPHGQARQARQRQQRQQQQHVVQQLCDLTRQHVGSFTPQTLAYALQGIAAAVAAGAAVLAAPAAPLQGTDRLAAAPLVPGPGLMPSQAVQSSWQAVQLGAELPRQLWERLMIVAGSCTALQLARCLAGGQLLGWQLSSNGINNSSSSSSSFVNNSSNSSGLCCWPVVEAAAAGLMGSGLPGSSSRQQLAWSSREAGQLLHALAGYVQHHQQQQPGQPAQPPGQERQERQQQMLQQALRHQLVQRLADHACQVLSEQPTSVRLGEGVTYLHTPSSSSSSSTDMGTVAAGSTSTSSSSSSSRVTNSSEELAAAVCVVQAAARLHLLPNPQQLEALLDQLEPQLHCLSPQQLLQLLQGLLDLQVEPWTSWLNAAYGKLEVGLALLPPQQVLQLLQLLPHVKTVQPSQQLLEGLAKASALHCCRLSWQQLAMLPQGFVAVGFRPEPYWMRDYVAATSTHMAMQQRLQQQQVAQQGSRPQQQCEPGVECCLQLDVLVDMLIGVSHLALSPPPPAWLAALEQLLVASLTAAAAAASTHDCTSHSAAEAHCLSPERAAVLHAFGQLQHTPCQEVQQLLGCGGGVSSSANSSSGVQLLSPPAAAVGMQVLPTGAAQQQQQQVLSVSHSHYHVPPTAAAASSSQSSTVLVTHQQQLQQHDHINQQHQQQQHSQHQQQLLLPSEKMTPLWNTYFRLFEDGSVTYYG